MTKGVTLEKQAIAVKEFERLMRSGKDFTTSSMYEAAGKKVFIEWRTAGDLIRKHYKQGLTDEMKSFVSSNCSLEFDELHKLFCAKFKVCKREGRYLIGLMR